MLSELKIENVAVIEKASINFENGLNIMTGETGAGKSIVIDSINAVLGERTSKEIVRDGTSAAKITAFFENVSSYVSDVLSQIGIEPEADNTLLISRTITADGRSTCRVNGQPITASMLKTLGRELITICGQHDSQHLLQKETHISYVDFLSDIQDELEDYKAIYDNMRKAQKELSHLKQNIQDRSQRLDFLQYQINEIENAKITIGEKEQLLEDKKKILNKEKMQHALFGAQSIINGDENFSGIVSSLYALSRHLAQLGQFNQTFSSYEEAIDNFKYEIEDCLGAISDEISSLDETGADINEIEERLDILYRLSRKYGESEEDILSYYEQICSEYESIESSDEKQAELELKLEKYKTQLLKKAEEISNKRQNAAKKFEKAVMNELSYLDMPSAVFEVSFERTEPTALGIDDVEFIISANAGQAPKPLSKIASGGELSRIMLAIKCVLSECESCDTMIFDEIDTGVSGRAAHKIAYKLKQVSSSRQVICVTHLAQIAAASDNHFLIEKHHTQEKTSTEVRKLVGDEKIREIARIIGGDVITETTLKSACELIDFADTP